MNQEEMAVKLQEFLMDQDDVKGTHLKCFGIGGAYLTVYVRGESPDFVITIQEA